MKDTDEAGDEIFTFVQVEEHTRNNAVDGGKEAIEKLSVFQEVDA